MLVWSRAPDKVQHHSKKKLLHFVSNLHCSLLVGLFLYDCNVLMLKLPICMLNFNSFKQAFWSW